MKFLLKSLICSLGLLSLNLNSQQFDPIININSQNINQTETAVFDELKNSISDFLINNSFSQNVYSSKQKIKLSIVVTINKYSDYNFVADFDFQSFRPVFNSEYQTSNFRFKDNNVSFRFEPNEPMTLMNNRFSGDLVSLLSFYSFIIIGYDMDTFVENSGNDYYKSAKNILDRALSFSSSSNWNPQSNGGRINKYWLIDSLLSSNYSIFKKINYDYHIKGIDQLISNKDQGLSNILNIIKYFKEIEGYRPNSILSQIFFQSKNLEIFNILNTNKIEKIDEVISDLNNIAPFFSNQWNNLN